MGVMDEELAVTADGRRKDRRERNLAVDGWVTLPSGELIQDRRRADRRRLDAEFLPPEIAKESDDEPLA